LFEFIRFQSKISGKIVYALNLRRRICYVGKKAGVSSRLQKLFPKIVSLHGSNHGLEVTVSCALDEIHGINDFQIFLDKLCFLYNQSHKNQRELDDFIYIYNSFIKHRKNADGTLGRLNKKKY
jgi:hypothetical protein